MNIKTLATINLSVFLWLALILWHQNIERYQYEHVVSGSSLAFIRHDIIKGTTRGYFIGVGDSRILFNLDYESDWTREGLNKNSKDTPSITAQQVIDLLKEIKKSASTDEKTMELQELVKQLIDSDGFKRLPEQEQSELLRLYNEKLSP